MYHTTQSSGNNQQQYSTCDVLSVYSNLLPFKKGWAKESVWGEDIFAKAQPTEKYTMVDKEKIIVKMWETQNGKDMSEKNEHSEVGLII